MNRTSKTQVRLERDPVLVAEADELDRQLVGSDLGARAGRRAARAARAATGPRCRGRRRPRRGRPRAAGAPRRSSRRCPCSSPSGWRWRVSLKRRIRTSSLASRKTTRGRMPRPSRAPRIAARAMVASPARTSSTIATRAKRSRSVDDELGEVGQQLAGQVVDDGVAEVLEELGRGGLAATGQPADDDDGRFGHRVGRGTHLGRIGHLPGAPDEQDGQLEQDVHRPAEHERADEVAAGRRDGREDRDAQDDHPARRRSAAPRSGCRPSTGRPAGSGTPSRGRRPGTSSSRSRSTGRRRCPGRACRR